MMFLNELVLVGEEVVDEEMVGSGCMMRVGVQPSWQRHPIVAEEAVKLIPIRWFPASKSNNGRRISRRRRPFCVPEPPDNRGFASASASEQVELELKLFTGRIRNSGIISSCTVGLLTGVAVVLFNNVVHEIRDFFWDGIPYRGASWLREAPIQETWTRVILVPAFGGVVVALLNLLRSRSPPASRPFFKAMAASFTLGTGNSLGPEGPSVDIGTSIAKGLDKASGSGRMLSLLAAGSAAGLSAGFNAAVAGCFFAVESVLWPSPADQSLPLTNTTSMVILSAVIASVVSEIGLGSEPAFKVPEYDFRSPGGKPSGFYCQHFHFCC